MVYANIVSSLISVPLFISKGADYIDDALQFVYGIVKEV
jgi:hypothetical protein